MGINAVSLRDQFPVTRSGVYLNTPYIGPSPQSVVDATKAFLQAKADNPVKLGEMLGVTRDVRQKFARLVNADIGEIGLLSTTSEGENIVTAALDLKAGDNLVIDDLHYDTTVVLYQQLAKTRGVEIRVVENREGESHLEDFERLIDARTRLVSVSWVSHQNGFRHDLQGLATLVHAHNAFLYVDAIQGIGALEFDVRQTGVDFFSCGTYKWLFGGFGVAAFYVRSELLGAIRADRTGWRQVAGETPDGEHEFHQDARKFGYATPAFAAVYQFNAALDFLASTSVSATEKHTVSLANQLNQSLRDKGFKVLTPRDNRSPIVAFEHGDNAERAMASLDAAGIQVSFREGNSQVRAGVALFNNKDDINLLLDVCDTWS